MKPAHCNQPAKEYRKLYYCPNGAPHSIETGWRCRVCGSIRIPTGAIFPDRSAEYEATRLEGIAFDESLSRGVA